MGDIFVAASCASLFSGNDVVGFAVFDTQCECKRERCGLEGLEGFGDVREGPMFFAAGDFGVPRAFP